MSKIIAVDFDGTLCEDRWPDIGAPNRNLIDWLINRQIEGDKLILWTCREGFKLNEAVRWCKAQGLFFDAINCNLPERAAKWGDSRKISADVFIDDRNDVDLSWRFELPFKAKRKAVQISMFDLNLEV